MATPRQALDTLMEAVDDRHIDQLGDRFDLDIMSVFGSVLDLEHPRPGDLDICRCHRHRWLSAVCPVGGQFRHRLRSAIP